MFEFSEHHGAILHLVVQLQTLNEVLKGAGVLGVLDLLVDGVKLEENIHLGIRVYSRHLFCVHLFKLEEVLSLLLGASELRNHLEGGVEVEAAEAVSQVEQVHPRLSLEVVDVKSEAGALHVFGSEFSLNTILEKSF